MSRLGGAVAAVLILCAATMPLRAAPAAGSVEPAESASTETPAAEESKPAVTRKAKKTVRKHRRHRYASYYRPSFVGFYFPPPRYWFHTSYPRYRYYRHHRRHYAGFPFFFRFRW